MQDIHRKIQGSHLKRNAYLYVRQSSLKQVYNNTESTKRQYALSQRAQSLGWSIDQIIVIDQDQGQSGASKDREGFQRLVAEVGLGHAGIVMGLEVSRLARNSTEWHRLLEICALSDTLILDEEGIYNPNDFNDRLLLGMKGTLSEAELFSIRARLEGGKKSKALRGELRTRLPSGYIYNHNGQVVKDPDKQVRETVQFLFETYHNTGSARATVKAFRDQGLKFPRRIQNGEKKGEIFWVELKDYTVRQLLHNPRYAGAYFYGRSKAHKGVYGKYVSKRLPTAQWFSFIKDVHEGYISWDEYESNLKRLEVNAQAYGGDRKKSPPREGPALLQGIVICGKCGSRMTVRYHSRKNGLVPNYVCQKSAIENALPVCQDIAGTGIDEEIAQLLLKVVNPVSLEVALTVQKQVQSQLEAADRLRKQHIQRAQYEADLARQRYMQTDPNNRLVADVLETEWNEKLRLLAAAQQEYEKQGNKDKQSITEKQKEEILSLVADFPKIWNNPQTPDREKKRMVRLILEDVTLFKQQKMISVKIRFKGGVQESLKLRVPMLIWESVQHSPEVVETVDQLLELYTDEQVACKLNQTYPHPQKIYKTQHIARMRKNYNLKSRFDRLREKGLLTQEEISQMLNINQITVRIWRDQGFLKAYPYNSKNECLYEPPAEQQSVKMQGVSFLKRKTSIENQVPISQTSGGVV